MIAMVLLIPAWLAIGFFGKNFQVGPEVFLVWYFMGAAIMSACFGAPSFGALVPSWKIVGAILLVGLTVGGIANMFLFRAVAGAPNPGLPVALANVASIGVFLMSILLARWLPAYFNSVKFDAWSAVGVVLTIAGASIIAIRR